MNYRMIKNVLGWILLFEAAFLFIPAIAALIFREDEIVAILISIALCVGIGGILLFVGKPRKTTLYSKEGFVIVSLSWILLSAFGALPFFISGQIPSYIDAFFETVSGFTTTGASIIKDVEAFPKSLLLWRSFTNWIGGMGVLVFVMAFIPLSGATNMHIMKAESPGPSVSKLVPRVKTTALILYSIYFILTVIQFVLLIIGGIFGLDEKMGIFEALCTAFSTAGTGGFGIKNDNFNGFSTYTQIVIAVFMLLFSVNFTSYYLVTKKKFKEALNSEVRCFFVVVFAATMIITINIYGSFNSLRNAIKHAFFNVSSIISTTGFATADFAEWPALSRGILLLLMMTGACAGSTCGGIKLSRIIIFFKSLGREFRCMLHPKQVKKITVDNQPVENETVRSVTVYLICYTIVFIISYLIICFENTDFETGFSAVMTAINNIGPGLAKVGPYSNFAWLSNTSKLVLSFDMLAGRLELIPMLLLFHPSTWRKN